MGAWDTGNFDNDVALDWIAEFLDVRQFTRVVSELKRYQKNHRNGSEYGAEDALVASEIVAAMCGHADDTIPEDLAVWVSASRSKVKSEITALAVDVVKRIMNQSELQELWLESDSFQEWKNIQLTLLKRLQKPPQAKLKKKRVTGPLLRWQTDKGQIINHRYQIGNLPDIDSRRGSIERVIVDVTESFSLEDYSQIADWLSTQPGILIEITDFYHDDGESDGSANKEHWEIISDALSLFKFAQSIRFSLYHLHNISFLSEFKNLHTLDLHKYHNIELKPIADLPALKWLRLQGCTKPVKEEMTNDDGRVIMTSTAWEPEPESHELDLTQLHGCKASCYELIQDISGNAADSLDILSGCEELIIDCDALKMFEMPSLERFNRLRKLSFIATSKKSISNVLKAPSIEEMHLIMHPKKLKKCLKLIKDYSPLLRLTIISFSLEDLYCKEDKQAMKYIGLPRSDWVHSITVSE